MKTKQGNMLINCDCRCHDNTMYAHPEKPCMDCVFSHIGERNE